jgi:hypothetical protein
MDEKSSAAAVFGGGVQAWEEHNILFSLREKDLFRNQKF